MREPLLPRLRRAAALLVAGLPVVAVFAFTVRPMRPWHDAPASRFALDVETRAPLGPEATLWIEGILVDGRMLDLDTVPGARGWEGVARWDSGLPIWLRYREPLASGRLSWTGHTTVVRGEEWGLPAGLVLQRDGAPVARLRADSSDGRFVIGEPSALPGPFPWIVGALLVGALSYWRAPWRRGWDDAWWIGGLLTLAHVAYWAGQPIGLTNDSPGYHRALDNVVAGLPAYFPPGYPLLIGLASLVPGAALALTLTLAQHAMAVAAAMMAGRLATRWTTPGLGAVAALVAGLLPPVLGMSQAVMSEIPTMFTMTGAVWFAVRARDSGRMAHVAWAGLLAGLAGLLRVVPMAALVPITVVLLSTAPGLRRRAALVRYLVCAALPVTLALAWNVSRSFTPMLTAESGLHLFNRVVTEQGLVREDGPAAQALAARLGEPELRHLSWWQVVDHPAWQGAPREEILAAINAVVREGIRAYPLAFVHRSLSLAWREYTANASTWVPRAGETVLPTDPGLRPAPAWAPTMPAMQARIRLEAWHGTLWRLLTLLALLGVAVGVLGGVPIEVGAIGCVIGLYLFTSASLDYFAARHNLGVATFVVTLAMLPLHPARRRAAAAMASAWFRRAAAHARVLAPTERVVS
jgi:hypothetical protein